MSMDAAYGAIASEKTVLLRGECDAEASSRTHRRVSVVIGLSALAIFATVAVAYGTGTNFANLGFDRGGEQRSFQMYQSSSAEDADQCIQIMSHFGPFMGACGYNPSGPQACSADCDTQMAAFKTTCEGTTCQDPYMLEECNRSQEKMKAIEEARPNCGKAYTAAAAEPTPIATPEASASATPTPTPAASATPTPTPADSATPTPSPCPEKFEAKFAETHQVKTSDETPADTLEYFRDSADTVIQHQHFVNAPEEQKMQFDENTVTTFDTHSNFDEGSQTYKKMDESTDEEGGQPSQECTDFSNSFRSVFKLCSPKEGDTSGDPDCSQACADAIANVESTCADIKCDDVFAQMECNSFGPHQQSLKAKCSEMNPAFPK